jgi:hypothetical protein
MDEKLDSLLAMVTSQGERVRERLLPIAVVVGAGLGVFSQLADGVLPGRLFGILGNIAAPWGLAAFLVGRRTTSRDGARSPAGSRSWWASASTTSSEPSAGTLSER